jgi:TPR repeat protein
VRANINSKAKTSKGLDVASLLRCQGEIKVASQTGKVINLKPDQQRRLAAAIDRFYSSAELAGTLKEFVNLIDQGCADAYFYAGCIYEDGGGGVEQDLDKARFYYQKSIEESGAVEAYLGLAKFYYYGMGVERDYVRAFEYYKIVDEDTGNVLAQLMLGLMYQHGQGVQKDLTRAREYFRRAIDKGNVYAIQHLAFLEEELGNRLKGIWLRIKAGFLAFNVARKNPKDPRLRRG